MTQLFQTLLAGLSLTLIWELFKFFYPEAKRVFKARRDANKAFYKNLDPILKSASELYGKLESLAKEDFSTFHNPENSISINPEHNKKYVYYLFSQFWAQLEYLRLESQYTALSKIKKGNQLLRFIETIESRKFRILDRSIQRIIGENLISQKNQKFRILTLNDFILNIEMQDSTLRSYILELENVLNERASRQQILSFGVIVAILIDHFDPKSKSVRRRDIYKNKLSIKSKKRIENILLSHYLPFVRNKAAYY